MNSDAVFPSVSFHDDLDIYRLILRLEIGVPVCLNVYLQGIGALLQLSRDPDLSLLHILVFDLVFGIFKQFIFKNTIP